METPTKRRNTLYYEKMKKKNGTRAGLIGEKDPKVRVLFRAIGRLPKASPPMMSCRRGKAENIEALYACRKE